jgi:hypothetical protein
MKDKKFQFSVDLLGDIEDINVLSDNMKVDCKYTLIKILNGKKLGLGERTEGMCEVEDGIIKLDYRVCTNVGDDWNTDVWEDIKEEFPVSELP